MFIHIQIMIKLNITYLKEMYKIIEVRLIERSRNLGKLQTLLHVDELPFQYDEINRMIGDNPTEALAYLDGLFITLSEKRAMQLAGQTGRDKTKPHLFQASLLHLAWQHMKVELNARMREFRIADEYIKISRSIYSRKSCVSRRESEH